jgi:hypothetical protein
VTRYSSDEVRHCPSSTGNDRVRSNSDEDRTVLPENEARLTRQYDEDTRQPLAREMRQAI